MRWSSWTAIGAAVGCAAASFLFGALFDARAPLARNWAHNPVAMAEDYLSIVDNRALGDMVMVVWAASPLSPPGPERAKAAAVFDKFGLIGVVHAKGASDGTFSAIDEPAPSASAGNGTPLSLLSNDNLSPEVLGVITIMEAVMNRAMGQTGKAMKWYVFDPAVLPCEKGALTVKYSRRTVQL